MLCRRCRGLMVSDHLEDLRDEHGSPRIVAWRCVCCEYIVDALIVQHGHQRESLQWYAMYWESQERAAE